MDIPIDGNCKYYKCRSLLACDTGGTVYETNTDFHDSGNTGNALKSNDQNQSKSYSTENITYIIDRKKQSVEEKHSRNDSITHIDDDQFNDYEMNSNLDHEAENAIIQYITQHDKIEIKPEMSEFTQNEDSIFFSNNNIYDDVQNLNNQILESNLINIKKLEHYEDLNNLNIAINTKDINDNITIDHFLSNDIIYDGNENNLQQVLNSSQTNSELSEINNLIKQEINRDKYDLSIDSECISNKKHTHKRKQIYTIKDDLYTELINEDQDILNKIMISNIKSKKKKSPYNKENQKKKLHQLKRNPFTNLKMNSILKGNKKITLKRIKGHCSLQKRESPYSNDENFESSYNNPFDEYFEQNFSMSNDDSIETNYSNSNDEDSLANETCYQPDYYTSFHSQNSVLHEIGAIIKLNSEFENADYLEYVQPRERIIESNMDKLLSPTIETEFSEIIKTCNVTQTINDKQDDVDCNGNQLDSNDIHKLNKSKSVLTPQEIAERELFLKSKYAKKLGYENYFNTSNESIVNEILFDTSLSYEKIKLDLNFLKHVEIYSKKNSLLDKSFDSVSCTLLKSINEFNHFDEFDEEIYEEKNIKDTEASSNLFINSELNTLSKANKLQKEKQNFNLVNDIKEKDNNHINANFNFNFSNKSNLLDLDFQSKYNSLDYFNNVTKSTSNSLKIKIKRVNDENNEYMIDDSIGHVIDINKKKFMMNSEKNIYRYRCYNCSSTFKTKSILKNHVSESHGGPYDTECEICHMKFKKSSAHKKHQPWCLRNVTHKCDICSKVYCYRASLIKHLKTHKKLIY